MNFLCMESYLSTLWGELNGAGEVDFFIKGLAKFPFKFLGHDIYITTAHVCALIVMVALIIFAIIANRVIKKAIVTDTPGNFQNVVELIVEQAVFLSKSIYIFRLRVESDQPMFRPEP